VPDKKLTTIEKALALNFDPLKYGTIVEIGAGQEVSRWFFQAGGAAGSIAKTMSAYDMDVSDDIYGVTADKRYVSKDRLERMLKREFELNISRLQDKRSEDSQYFAFANTVAAQGFKKREECHGWLGIRLQLTPQSEPDDIILHVRMLDDLPHNQQEALGILGVNLIYGAYFLNKEPEALLSSLMDNLRWGRIEIDLVEFRGPTLGAIDDRLMALHLVKESLTRAVMFDLNGMIVIPADTLYKQSVFGIRGAFHTVSDTDIGMFNHAKEKFLKKPNVDGNKTVSIAEMTMADIANEEGIDTADFLRRVDALSAQGFYVLISEFFRYFRVRQYLGRYTREPVAIVSYVNGFAEIIREDYYQGLDGGILEGLGQLFIGDTTFYIFPNIEDGKIAEPKVSLNDLPIAGELRPLVTYLHQRGQIVPIDDFSLE
jgi:hypothetical protein